MLATLATVLGPVGMVRFLQQFETGSGDYTAERHQWLPDDIDRILNDVKRKTPMG